MSYDPEDSSKSILLHPTRGYVIYRGYVDENKLPNGHGVQYSSIASSNKYKTLSIDGTIHYIGHRLRGGYWVMGKLNGKGYQYYNKELIYRGYFVEDKPHGKGTFYKNKLVDQDGTWVNGSIYNGYGTIFYEDGTKYKGYVINGIRNGEGVLFDKNNKDIKKGNWINNILQ
jgi:hypothetical protein